MSKGTFSWKRLRNWKLSGSFGVTRFGPKEFI